MKHHVNRSAQLLSFKSIFSVNRPVSSPTTLPPENIDWQKNTVEATIGLGILTSPRGDSSRRFKSDGPTNGCHETSHAPRKLRRIVHSAASRTIFFDHHSFSKCSANVHQRAPDCRHHMDRGLRGVQLSVDAKRGLKNTGIVRVRHFSPFHFLSLFPKETKTSEYASTQHVKALAT